MGLIYPSEFIPFAEQTGLIIPMGEWILAEACRQLKAWQDRYPRARQIKVSVNLSSKQFFQPNLVDQVAQVLKETGLDASCLRLEITETVIMENAEMTIAALRQLREMGVQIHVDDFGTGYSSLVYLHMLALNAIKIDRSFISGQSNRSGRLEIARMIVRLAADLRLETVAEGVETEQHLLQLQAIGCDYAQGFLFARTMEPRLMEQYLQDELTMPPWKVALLKRVH